MKAIINEKDKTLTIVIDIQEPVRSSSGKTLVVASSHGNQAVGVNIGGKALIVGLNAYVRV